jgi:anti-sigma factor RsiW
MCDVQGQLIGWIDRELPADQAGEVARHVETCEECRHWVATYGQVDEAFDAYCDVVMAAKAPRRGSRFVPVFAAAVVFAASVMLLALLRTRVEPSPIVAPTVASASVPNPVTPPATEPARRKVTMRRHSAATERHTHQVFVHVYALDMSRMRRVTPHVPERGAEVQAMESAIEIAIPAEAMFPPGAVPNGINFIAELRIAPDGSVKQVRLRQ